MREAPAQREQAPELHARGRVISDVAPREGNIEAPLHLVGLAVRDVEPRALVPSAVARALGEVLHRAVGRIDQLLGKVAVLLPDLLDEGAQLTDNFEGDFIGDQHGHWLLWLGWVMPVRSLPLVPGASEVGGLSLAVSARPAHGP
jgi:hypothetical protein